MILSLIWIYRGLFETHSLPEPVGSNDIRQKVAGMFAQLRAGRHAEAIQICGEPHECRPVLTKIDLENLA